MKKVKEQELTQLFEKFSADKSTKEEFHRLLDSIEEGTHDDHLHRLLKKQWDEERRSIPNRRPHFRWFAVVAATAVAAAVFVFLTLPTLFQSPFQPSKEYDHPDATLASVEEGDIPEVLEVTRIKLPDGSTVLLREGSWLDISDSFEERIREVHLEGEAYFDIASNPNKPFVIHTGKIKTTVLGTSFSIKALANEPVVTVTVVTGKVKVEDEQKVLATLDADKQFVYHTESEQVQEKEVEAEKELDWRLHDLVFRSRTFGYIVQELTILYEASILFEDEAMEQRVMTASVDSRYPITYILDILCTSQRAYFDEEEGVYTIKSLKKQID